MRWRAPPSTPPSTSAHAGLWSAWDAAHLATRPGPHRPLALVGCCAWGWCLMRLSALEGLWLLQCLASASCGNQSGIVVVSVCIAAVCMSASSEFCHFYIGYGRLGRDRRVKRAEVVAHVILSMKWKCIWYHVCVHGMIAPPAKPTSKDHGLRICPVDNAAQAPHCRLHVVGATCRLCCPAATHGPQCVPRRLGWSGALNPRADMVRIVASVTGAHDMPLATQLCGLFAHGMASVGLLGWDEPAIANVAFSTVPWS